MLLTSSMSFYPGSSMHTVLWWSARCGALWGGSSGTRRRLLSSFPSFPSKQGGTRCCRPIPLR
ncbi:unnamed protein product [Ectocarpus sp. 12 AP-2014]